MRNGSGIYSKPAGTTFVPNTVIQSSKVNEIFDDIAADLNLERPIVAGGTGGTSASEARTNLGVDQASAYSTKAANYTALATDDNSFIRFSAAATLSLTAAATLATGWNCTVIADGGAVTIDPNGAELVNGAATQIIPDGFTATIICDGSAFRTTSINSVLTELASIGVGLMANYLTGYTLSNNVADATNDIDIAAGVCMDSTNTSFIKLASGITKRMDAAWAVGTNQGCLDTGSLSDQTYHLYAIKRLDTGVVDIIASADEDGPTMPDDYTVFRRIGSLPREAGAMIGITQRGDQFLRKVAVRDVNGNQNSSASQRVLSVPLGIQVDALIRVRAENASGWSVLFSALDVTDTAPSLVDAPLGDIGGTAGVADRATLSVRTDVFGRIRARSTVNTTDLQIITYGWIDTRGK
jgi:hypothetical protein